MHSFIGIHSHIIKGQSGIVVIKNTTFKGHLLYAKLVSTNKNLDMYVIYGQWFCRKRSKNWQKNCLKIA